MAWRLAIALCIAVQSFPAANFHCREVGYCTEMADQRGCLLHGEHTHAGFVSCAWALNIYGSMECRADFKESIRSVVCQTLGSLKPTTDFPL